MEKLNKNIELVRPRDMGALWHVLLRRHLNRMNRELVGPMVKRLRTIQENLKVKKFQLQRPNLTWWPVHIYINIAQPFRVGVLFQGNPVPASCLSSAWFAHHLDSAKKINNCIGTNVQNNVWLWRFKGQRISKILFTKVKKKMWISSSPQSTTH